MVGSWCPPISEVHGLASHGQAVPLLYFLPCIDAFSMAQQSVVISSGARDLLFLNPASTLERPYFPR
jgi:hypothetical protein